MTPWPSGKVYLSHCGLMFIRVVAFSSCSIWISLSKWPMLPTMALFFIFFMCSRVMMSLLPVVVMKTSASEIRSSIVTTWYPSMHACSAQIGSISVTYVIAFCARIDAAEQLLLNHDQLQRCSKKSCQYTTSNSTGNLHAITALYAFLRAVQNRR